MKYLGGPIHDGTLKWMVYFMENPTKMDENRGYPHLYETSIWKNHWWFSHDVPYPNYIPINSEWIDVYLW